MTTRVPAWKFVIAWKDVKGSWCDPATRMVCGHLAYARGAGEYPDNVGLIKVFVFVLFVFDGTMKGN